MFYKLETSYSNHTQHVLINLLCVAAFEPLPNGETQITLANGKVYKSKKRVNEFEEILGINLFGFKQAIQPVSEPVFKAYSSPVAITQDDPDLAKEVSVEGPKVMTDRELKEKLGQKLIESKPKRKPAPKKAEAPTPKGGTTSAALD